MYKGQKLNSCSKAQVPQVWVSTRRWLLSAQGPVIWAFYFTVLFLFSPHLHTKLSFACKSSRSPTPLFSPSPCSYTEWKAWNMIICPEKKIENKLWLPCLEWTTPEVSSQSQGQLGLQEKNQAAWALEMCLKKAGQGMCLGGSLSEWLRPLYGPAKDSLFPTRQQFWFQPFVRFWLLKTVTSTCLWFACLKPLPGEVTVKQLFCCNPERERERIEENLLTGGGPGTWTGASRAQGGQPSRISFPSGNSYLLAWPDGLNWTEQSTSSSVWFLAQGRDLSKILVLVTFLAAGTKEKKT